MIYSKHRKMYTAISMYVTFKSIFRGYIVGSSLTAEQVPGQT